MAMEELEMRTIENMVGISQKKEFAKWKPGLLRNLEISLFQ